jgi:hypothetical protein
MRKLGLVTSVLVLAATALLPAYAPAGPPVKSSFDDTVSFTVTGICTFPLAVTSSLRGTVTDFFDDGALVRSHIHVVEQDTFSANGRSVTGEPFTFNVFLSFDENGEATAILARGVAEKIRLPNAKLFLSAGVIDFLAQGVDFSLTTDRGRTGDIDAFCAALSPQRAVGGGGVQEAS